MIGLVIADSIAISEDTTKSKGATLKLQKSSMYLAQAVRKDIGTGTLRTLLAAFHKRDAQRSTARGEAPNEAEDALAKLTPHVLRKFMAVVESTAERTTQKKVQLTSEICRTLRNFVYDKLFHILTQASASVRHSRRRRIEAGDLYPAGMLALTADAEGEDAD